MLMQINQFQFQFQTKFTDRTLKCAISAAWVTGILIAMTWLVWLINADLSKCDLVPGQFYLLEVVVIYIPVCITKLICYGRILVISWRQHNRIEPINVSSVHGSTHTVLATSGDTLALTQNSSADLTKYTKHKDPTASGPHTVPKENSGTAFSAEAAYQQLQQIKSRRREFKAV